jgi:hypothetical protein
MIMGHASIKKFLRHYLSRRVTVDTQAVVRGIQPQDTLMRAACTMSRSIDRRRPRRLTTEQSASVNEHPTLRSLFKQRERLKSALKKSATKDFEYKELSRKINQERQYQRRILLRDVKERWEYERPTRDVERQLAEGKIEHDPEVASETMLPAQKELVDYVLSQPGTTIEEETCGRDRAVRAVMLYCGVEEGGTNCTRTKRQKEITRPAAKTHSECDKEALETAKVSVFKDKRPKICFLCLGNEKLPVDVRTHPFHTSGDLSKHFKRKHLQHVKAGESLECELCQVSLGNKMHLQRYAYEIHGTVSSVGI